MKKWSILTVILACISASNAADSNTIKPFSTDGCSSFPDKSLINKQINWKHCCMAHDYWYWTGGIEELRNEADAELEQCVADFTGDKHLARNMKYGVFFGGSSLLPTTWRWGYGHTNNEKSRPLKVSELKQALAKFDSLIQVTEEVSNTDQFTENQNDYLRHSISKFKYSLEMRLDEALKNSNIE